MNGILFTSAGVTGKNKFNGPRKVTFGAEMTVIRNYGYADELPEKLIILGRKKSAELLRRTLNIIRGKKPDATICFPPGELKQAKGLEFNEPEGTRLFHIPLEGDVVTISRVRGIKTDKLPDRDLIKVKCTDFTVRRRELDNKGTAAFDALVAYLSKNAVQPLARICLN